MEKDKKKRAVVIVGAGASVEYGVPVTIGLGQLIEEAIHANDFCKQVGGAAVYTEIKDELEKYYSSEVEAHFERIYHVLHELLALDVTPGAVPKFLPVMLPFLSRSKVYDNMALRAACDFIVTFIYNYISSICSKPKCSVKALEDFFIKMSKHYTPRVYSTNYDDFIEQATGGRLFTGFTDRHGDHFDFSPVSYWSNWDQPGLFHLHGSVHMGFPHEGHEIGDIVWYRSREDAARNAKFSGSGLSRMDGTQLDRSVILTGLDKLGRIQQSPYVAYYAGLSRDVQEADVIFVLGSGLADLHLNICLREARRARPDLPILFVGYWGEDAYGLINAIRFDYGDREISLFHDLRIDLYNLTESQFKAGDGWVITSDAKAAVWASGFQSFLQDSAALQSTMEKLGLSW